MAPHGRGGDRSPRRSSQLHPCGRTLAIPWRDDCPDLTAWREGRTGFPTVDAAMRELAETGWIANRARLIAASFLTRELFLDWRLGARHFLRTLVDGDVANNAANWQWVAGVGTDAAP
ncbi:MAG TPA: FAD-binding domain-containing protein, partial [Acidimicrobiales bacterium]|nr:FAD-binding domain-containing protein [Acidimicrobiales bacterium]